MINRYFIDAWNRGDIETACGVYAEDATYIGKGGIINGRENIVKHYRNQYPSVTVMGILALKFVEFRCHSLASPVMASGVLEFELLIPTDLYRGYTLEVYAMYGGELCIVQDMSIGKST
ncbi:MAG: nuclear transport factor 2 family protein [Patescibacteria group bacterium]